jgi:hypothetical protein
MKKIFAFTMLLALFACDDNPVRTQTVEVDKPTTTVQTNITKKTVILAKGAVYDTVRTKFENNSIVGSLISNGTTSVVCSEQMNRCAKTNSKGVYQINLPNRPLVAGRIYEGIDTVATPENVNLSLGDTTVTPLGNDTDIVSDTLIDSTVTVFGNDTLIVVNVEQIDTIYSADSILVEISEPTTVAIKDTLSVVSAGTILREIPINSWGHILDSGFVDKWSIEVYDTIYTMYVDTVQFIYFATGDSIAQVVTLGREKINGLYTNRFSGVFFYYWDDSAYSKDKYIHNYFIRAKDSSGYIVSKTDMVSFSAKAFPETRTYLKKNIHTPQYMIQPKFVPAAKNNKKLRVAQTEYLLTEDKSKNWIGIEQLPFDTGSDYEGSIYFNDHQYADFSSLGIDSISFYIETLADSILIGYELVKPYPIYTLPNTKKHYKIPVIEGRLVKIMGWSKGTMYISKVTNIRFYFKQN